MPRTTTISTRDSLYVEEHRPRENLSAIIATMR